MSSSKVSKRAGILVPGIFDLFHVGHRHLIQKTLEEFNGVPNMVIGVYTDTKIRKSNFQKPIFSEEQRFNKVSEWIDITYPKNSYDITVYLLNENENYLKRKYNLSTVVCGKGYTKYNSTLLIGKIHHVSKLIGISSLDIQLCRHPLLKSQEIWIFNGQCKNLNLQNEIEVKKVTSISLKEIQISDKHVTIIANAKSFIPSHFVENDRVSILRKDLDFDTEDVISNILEYRNMFLIQKPPLHDNMAKYEDFEILLHKEEIEEGGYGSIYPVIHKNKLHDKFVAKIVEVTHEQQFYLECILCVRAGRFHYGPVVHAYFYCPEEESGVIIMERWEGDMDKEYLDESEFIDLLNVVAKMHDDGIFHHDLYMRNILYRTNPYTQKREFCVADYGLAFPLTHVPNTLRSADMASLIYGLYEPERVAVVDGIEPKDIRENVFNFLETAQISKEDWLTGIRWRVLNTIEEDGTAPIPKNEIDFIDGPEMYECVFKLLERDIIKDMEVHVFLDRLAYTEWISSKRARKLDRDAIQWYVNLSK